MRYFNGIIQRSRIAAARKICGCREENICRRIECCFCGILQHANNKAYANDLHSQVIGNAKQAASHRNQKQGTAGNAGSAASSYSRQYAKQQCRRKIDINA